MITDKQRQRDYEYDGDYQSKSRYTEEQWNNILSSGQLSDEDISLLKQIYGSFNHAATLVQLAFHNKTTEEALLAQVNAMGELLGDKIKAVHFKGKNFAPDGTMLHTSLEDSCTDYAGAFAMLRTLPQPLPVLREEAVPARAAGDIAFIKQFF